MNRQKPDGLIGWAEFSWNPIVGCTEGCSYCYAREAMSRFGRIRGCRMCEAFTPHIHRERLVGPRSPMGRMKSAWIFCDSVADWWCPGVHWSWRRDAMTAMKEAPQHDYVLLTKCPELICPHELSLWAPPNLWVGVSVTGENDWWRIEQLNRALMKTDSVHGVVSFEPLLHGIRPDHLGYEGVDWVIIGGLSGEEWARDAVVHEHVLDWAERCGPLNNGAAVWEKSNLGEIGRPYRRERPGGL